MPFFFFFWSDGFSPPPAVANGCVCVCEYVREDEGFLVFGVFLNFLSGVHYLFSFSLLGHSKLDTFLALFFCYCCGCFFFPFTRSSSYGKPGSLLNQLGNTDLRIFLWGGFSG